MNKLAKGPKPPILVEKEIAWTAEYEQAVASGNQRVPERWRHPQIKEAIDSETGARCAYCESSMRGITWNHVEHVLPKVQFPQLVVAWQNLTSACPICNVNKGPYYSESAPLLNPYVDRCDERIVFAGSLPLSALGDTQGARTVAVLKLDRPDLVSEREKRIRAVNRALEEWNAADPMDKIWLADGIRIDAADGEFTVCVKSFLRSRGFPVESP